ncbi:hypothetical protein [Burkholderia ubonensis]|uniref:hypothetical protein n=1 Tax=Burkholderia ubonensis TaxID=101571 RepID=UPI001055FCDF
MTITPPLCALIILPASTDMKKSPPRCRRRQSGSLAKRIGGAKHIERQSLPEIYLLNRAAFIS